MTPFVDRIIRAAKLDARLYEEVEADKSAMGQAMGVVVLSSLAGGIGFMHVAGLMGMVIGAVGSLIGWYIWAFFDLPDWNENFSLNLKPMLIMVNCFGRSVFRVPQV